MDSSYLPALFVSEYGTGSYIFGKPSPAAEHGYPNDSQPIYAAHVLAAVRPQIIFHLFGFQVASLRLCPEARGPEMRKHVGQTTPLTQRQLCTIYDGKTPTPVPRELLDQCKTYATKCDKHAYAADTGKSLGLSIRLCQAPLDI